MTVEKLRETLRENYSKLFEYEIVDGNILDIHSFSMLSNEMGEKEYNSLQDKIKNYTIDKKDYQLYFWSDESGYDYWKNDYNYMLLTLYIKDFSNIHLDELYKDIDTIITEFEEYIY